MFRDIVLKKLIDDMVLDFENIYGLDEIQKSKYKALKFILDDSSKISEKTNFKMRCIFCIDFDSSNFKIKDNSFIEKLVVEFEGRFRDVARVISVSCDNESKSTKKISSGIYEFNLMVNTSLDVGTTRYLISEVFNSCKKGDNMGGNLSLSTLTKVEIR